MRVGNRYAGKRNTLLSVAKRICQGVWIWQYRRGALDGAMVLYLNMLTEELLNSFGDMRAFSSACMKASSRPESSSISSTRNRRSPMRRTLGPFPWRSG